MDFSVDVSSDCIRTVNRIHVTLTQLNYSQLNQNSYSINPEIFKRPIRDACLCMGELLAPPAPPAPHFVFLITL